MLEVVSLSVGIDWDQQPVCDSSVISSSPLLAASLQALAAPPVLLIGFTINSHFHLQIHSPAWPFLSACIGACVCQHVLALSSRPGGSPSGERFHHGVCYFPAHLIYESEWGFLHNNITATLTQHSKTHLLTHKCKHHCSQSHTLVSCQSGLMSQP